MKILVIDDSPFVQDTLPAILQKHGHETLSAYEGQKGFLLYKKNPDIDLVVLDMIMPGIGGEKTFNKIMSYDENAQVIIYTGYSREPELSQILQNGALKVCKKDDSMYLIQAISVIHGRFAIYG